MQEKQNKQRWNVSTPSSAQGICQSEIKRDGKRVLQNKGTNAPLLQCVYVWVRESVWGVGGSGVGGSGQGLKGSILFYFFFLIYSFRM